MQKYNLVNYKELHNGTLVALTEKTVKVWSFLQFKSPELIWGSSTHSVTSKDYKVWFKEWLQWSVLVWSMEYIIFIFLVWVLIQISTMICKDWKECCNGYIDLKGQVQNQRFVAFLYVPTLDIF